MKRIKLFENFKVNETLTSAKLIGQDDWSRDIYKGNDGKTYVDVDGALHTMTSEGEPIAPVKNLKDIQIIKESQGVHYTELAPEVVTFAEAEQKLSKYGEDDGIVLTGIVGDIVKIEEEIGKFIKATHQDDDVFSDAYVIITNENGPASKWVSDVFLIIDRKKKQAGGGFYYTAQKDWNGMTIPKYFRTGPHANENVNEGTVRAVLASKDDLLALLKPLLRGEVATIKTTAGNVEMILSDIGLDQMESAIDDLKRLVGTLKQFNG